MYTFISRFKINRFVSLIFCFIMFACSSSSESKDSGHLAEISHRVQAILDSHADQMHFPAAIVTIAIEGEGEVNLVAGFADLETHVVAKVSDKFRISSITKTFTAATILLLQEEGSLNIDQTISDHLPQLAIPNASEITIEHLLSHTSGIADHEEGPGMDHILATLQQDPTHVFSTNQLIQIALDQGAHFNPGQGFSYSNTGYVILGLIIESVTGKSYSEAIQNYIIDPYDLTHTSVPLPDDETISGDHLHGYEIINDEIQDVTLVNHSWAFAEGEMISNTSDLANWIKKLVQGEVFELASTQLVMQSFIDAGDGLFYGLGLIKNPVLGLGHDGGTIGFTTNAFHNPENGVTLIVTLNTGIDGPLVYEVSEIINDVLN